MATSNGAATTSPRPGGPPPRSPLKWLIRRLLTILALPALVAAFMELGSDWPSGGSQLLRLYFAGFFGLSALLWFVGVVMPQPPFWPEARVTVFVCVLINIGLMVLGLLSMVLGFADAVLRTGFISGQVYGLLVLSPIAGGGGGSAGEKKLRARLERDPSLASAARWPRRRRATSEIHRAPPP
jgi:hypothetical protein